MCFFAVFKKRAIFIKSHWEVIFTIVTRVAIAFSSLVFLKSNCVFIDCVSILTVKYRDNGFLMLSSCQKLLHSNFLRHQELVL